MHSPLSPSKNTAFTSGSHYPINHSFPVSQTPPITLHKPPRSGDRVHYALCPKRKRKKRKDRKPTKKRKNYLLQKPPPFRFDDLVYAHTRLIIQRQHARRQHTVRRRPNPTLLQNTLNPFRTRIHSPAITQKQPTQIAAVPR